MLLRQVDADFAAHWRFGWMLLSGTLLFDNTPAAFDLLDLWEAHQHMGLKGDQDALGEAVLLAQRRGLRLAGLPARVYGYRRAHAGQAARDQAPNGPPGGPKGRRTGLTTSTSRRLISGRLLIFFSAVALQPGSGAAICFLSPPKAHWAGGQSSGLFLSLPCCLAPVAVTYRAFSVVPPITIEKRRAS